MKKMKILILFILLLMLFICMKVSFSEEIKYNTYFTDKTMRVDLYHTGNSTEDVYTLERIFKENKICSSEKNLIDYINNGRNFLKVYDERSGKLIFSHGFDSIFGEYQTTDDSIKGIKRTYSETLYMPYPKNNIIFTIERRDKYNKLNKVFEVMIDPASTNIINEKPSKEVEVIDFLINGDPREKVDILYIAEGYKKDQKQKFIDDVKRLIKVFFSYSPFREYKNSFNIRGAFLPSEDEGCDESSHGSFKSTAINCGFDFLGSERYLMTNDNYLLRKVCVNIPFDTIEILVNHKRYGGGAIYNLYATTIVDNYWTNYIFLHEFGHSFGGLADEYYSSSIEYNDFYMPGYEPVEPNITALLDKNNLKWKDLVTFGIEIPTFWEKEGYDKIDEAYQKKRQELNKEIAELKRSGAAKEKVKEIEELSEKLSIENSKILDEYLSKCKNFGKVGAFEGAGYCKKGMYRSEIDCLMFSKGVKPFCKACERAIIEKIRFYSGKR